MDPTTPFHSIQSRPGQTRSDNHRRHRHQLIAAVLWTATLNLEPSVEYSKDAHARLQVSNASPTVMPHPWTECGDSARNGSGRVRWNYAESDVMNSKPTRVGDCTRRQMVPYDSKEWHDMLDGTLRAYLRRIPENRARYSLSLSVRSQELIGEAHSAR
ncbi:hypothetical protein ASPVEDRAFT_652648 [Aspergillus versicolor CBS 583.65]|uniref:Uncharacterized protein n=1 Tax=Aspergillus versicolor CBS 583.65 TaxID=1036611 RepID=A0A1L9PK62_ASPVE|nr:uncharacterized protein ASPVEDRAFT_652648 [Aspergillus versicolor CBS 583.65]OJJ01881.1 hypothetical protein ASPVEDRAFT_652648 [Aspergillus versicolor CBS 583.65]